MITDDLGDDEDGDAGFDGAGVAEDTDGSVEVRIYSIGGRNCQYGTVVGFVGLHGFSSQFLWLLFWLKIINMYKVYTSS